jgi:hypothetical protein
MCRKSLIIKLLRGGGASRAVSRWYSGTYSILLFDCVVDFFEAMPRIFFYLLRFVVKL